MEDASITGRAYETLRADLIACRLKPGARLNISALQTKLTLSQASIREALSRLTAEGLVEIERHRGFRVAAVTMSGFQELTQACLVLELPCIRASIEGGDLKWELDLISTFHRAIRTLELVVMGREDIDAYSNERLAFHEALLAACDNSWLLAAWRMLYAQNMRYRHIYMPLAKFEFELNPLYQNFIKAVLARDADTALEVWKEHYDKMTAFIDQQIRAESDSAKTQPVSRSSRAKRKQKVPVVRASLRISGRRER